MPGADIDRFKETALKCPLPAAVELIGEKWAFLILRGALNGLHHFEEFQAGLGIARNILSDRLAKMVAGGILERSRIPATSGASSIPSQGRERASSQSSSHFVNGARNGAMARWISCLPTGAIEGPCARCASRRMTDVS